jgi:hypothetical protein
MNYINAATDKAANAVMLEGFRCSTDVCLLPFCRQVVLVVEPEAMLRLLESDVAEYTTGNALDECQLKAVDRARAWQRKNPWESKVPKGEALGSEAAVHASSGSTSVVGD